MDHVLRVVVEHLLADAVAGDAELKNRHARRAVSHNLRRQNSGRKLAQLKLGGRRNLRIGGSQIGVRLKKDANTTMPL